MGPKKRAPVPNGDDSDYTEVTTTSSKKQMLPSGRGLVPASSRKIGRKQEQVIDLDLEFHVFPRKLKAKCQNFPRFSDGTIYVELVEFDHKYTYCLQKDVIERSSDVLFTRLKQSVDEADKRKSKSLKKANGLEAFLELKFHPQKDIFALFNAPFTIKKPIEATLTTVTSTPEPSSATGLQTPPISKSQQVLPDSSQLFAGLEITSLKEISSGEPLVEPLVPETIEIAEDALDSSGPTLILEGTTLAPEPSAIHVQEHESTVSIKITKQDMVTREMTIREESENAAEDLVEPGENVHANEIIEDIAMANTATDTMRPEPMIKEEPEDFVITNLVADVAQSESTIKKEALESAVAKSAPDTTQVEPIIKKEDEDVSVAATIVHIHGSELPPNADTLDTISSSTIVSAPEPEQSVKTEIPHMAQLAIEPKVKEETMDAITSITDSPMQEKTNIAMEPVKPELEIIDIPEQTLGPKIANEDQDLASSARQENNNFIIPNTNFVSHEETANPNLEKAIAESSNEKVTASSSNEPDEASKWQEPTSKEMLVSITDPSKASRPSTDHETELIDDDVIMIEPPSINTIEQMPDWPRYAHVVIKKKHPAGNKNRSLEELNAMRRKSVEAHHSLILIFHSRTPKIDTKSASNAFDQIEQIVKLSKYYKCLEITRPSLTNHIFQFCIREIFQAIFENPPRWLLLSLDLESVPIFKEAMIHLVGQYPHYPWKDHPASSIPSSVKGLIREKVDNLEKLKSGIDVKLFLSSIWIKGQSLTFFKNFEGEGFSTWFIVLIWQDWLRQSLTKNDRIRYPSGTAYRLMAKGGDNYLDHRTVHKKLVANAHQSSSSWDLAEVKEELQIMKEYARKQVRALVVNESLLDVDRYGIQHLTCTKIEDDEVPWAIDEDENGSVL